MKTLDFITFKLFKLLKQLEEARKISGKNEDMLSTLGGGMPLNISDTEEEKQMTPEEYCKEI